ncbi:MAG: hypothetical protein RLZZ553_308 [Verrucomicrobiota bacterium]|jgi:glycine/D-amino acid oxidase-like deaminating enzyme
MKPIFIVGMGLAGACTAWHLWRRGIPFQVFDSGRPGSSQVAAGLIHPVTGKNCAVAEDFAIRRAHALQFYQSCQRDLDCIFWHELEVVRLLDRADFTKKSHKFSQGAAASWVKEILHDSSWHDQVSVILRGGARVDVPMFLSATKDFFRARGLMIQEEIRTPFADAITVFCEGSQGLIRGNPIPWKHRCARGEILTVYAASWRQKRMVTGQGWLVPVGQDCYKIGATYEWDEWDRGPTEAGRKRLMEMARFLGGENFDVITHEVGVRPILRKSQPVVGRIADGVYVLNGLGSKGSLYAPWAAEQLVTCMVNGAPLDSFLSVDEYFASLNKHS